MTTMQALVADIDRLCLEIDETVKLMQQHVLDSLASIEQADDHPADCACGVCEPFTREYRV